MSLAVPVPAGPARRGAAPPAQTHPGQTRLGQTRLGLRRVWGPDDPPTPVELARQRGAVRNTALLALCGLILLALKRLRPGP